MKLELTLRVVDDKGKELSSVERDYAVDMEIVNDRDHGPMVNLYADPNVSDAVVSAVRYAETFLNENPELWANCHEGDLDDDS